MPDSEDIEKAKIIERARARIEERESTAWKRRLGWDLYVALMLFLADVLRNICAAVPFFFGLSLLSSPTSVDLYWVSYTVSTGEGLIIAAILMVGGLIVWVMPREQSRAK